MFSIGSPGKGVYTRVRNELDFSPPQGVYLVLRMKKKLLSLLASGSLLFVSCATGYQAKGLTGGYSDFRLDANTFRVEFRGNAFTSRQNVETYLLYRCAELTSEAGYDYFVTVNSDTEARQGAYTTPGSYNST